MRISPDDDADLLTEADAFRVLAVARPKIHTQLTPELATMFTAVQAHMSWSVRFKLPAAARWGGWQRATFGEDLHVLERPCERRGLLRLVLLTGGVIRQHRVIEHQGVNQLRRGRGNRPRLKRAVIEIVGPASLHGLGVGVGKFGSPHEDLARDGTYGAEFAILARGDRAGYPEPFADIAELADALPDFGSGAVHRDLQRNGNVGRISGHAADIRLRSLRAGNMRQADHRERRADGSFTEEIPHGVLQ